ncbi:MAG: endoribonuclease MazF [Clostridia bacterium]|nr:MAG: endoribonuclease MazF [Clostridia bacterium]
MVSPRNYVPDRADIVRLEFSPKARHEVAGRRPALVVSPKSYNSKVGVALMCPLTSKRKGYPFEVPLPSTAGISGVVLADQIKNLDWQARKAEFVCKVPSDVTQEVLAKIQALIM